MAQQNPASQPIKTKPSFQTFCDQELKHRSGLLKDKGLAYIWVILENQKRQAIHHQSGNELVVLRHAHYQIPYLSGRDLSATCGRYFSSMIELIGDLLEELPEGKEELRGFSDWQPGCEMQHALGLGDAFVSVPDAQVWDLYGAANTDLEPGCRFEVPLVFKTSSLALRDAFISAVLEPALRRKGWTVVAQQSSVS